MYRARTRKMNKLFYQTLLSFVCCALGQQTSQNSSPTGLMPDQDDALLMFSTLDGSLIAIEQKTGDIRWQQYHEPAVKVPTDSLHETMPYFLPDPKDGSLYLYGPETEVLKKLPFTIPQLVASSPCRSSDGILYTGRKIDTWFSVDSQTGEREQLLGFSKATNTCPVDTKNAIFVGRTEYNIMMIDSKHKDRKWNVTFYDYSAGKMDPKLVENYDFAHFTSSSMGQVITLDRFGNILWNIDLGSPVIAAYTVSKDGLITIPFSSVSDNTLNLLMKKISVNPKDFELYPTLYIGEHRHGLYALPSLSDTSTPTISSKSGQLLLEGPLSSHFQKNDSENKEKNSKEESAGSNVLIDIIPIGHYEVPPEYQPHNQPLQITGRSDPIIYNNNNNIINASKINDLSSDDDKRLNETLQSKEWLKAFSVSYAGAKKWLNQQENKGFKITFIILFGCVFMMFWYMNAQFREIQHLSQNSRENSRTDSNSNNGSFYAPEEIGEGLVRVGKITINASGLLGKGCDGTFVYRGEFDGRPVAVKRLLPECFTFADREVALLRESDAHANVVRYFCTEQDKLFRYIALELAEATLQDYVLGTYDRSKISAKDILKQATKGLAHLHSLDIVHRDIKPHNVLLSMPGPRGDVRAMISDFGLCKKLQTGRMSFSRRSGVTGTEGWIAPEMLNGERTTTAVDVFSLGCVFYFVLSEGKHPFGDSVRRQANILGHEMDLSELKNIPEYDKNMGLLLIKAMIDDDPVYRPPARAIEDHPIFWDAAQILTFFQDVSDRVEKDVSESPALQALERGYRRVVQGDWRVHIDPEVASDLRKYRSYQGESVRDLLRALRNKKHHYRELTLEAQQSLGEIPTKFTDYWLSRFPYLLTHTWCAMQPFRHEPMFRNYYHELYAFGTDDQYEEDPAETERLALVLKLNEERINTANAVNSRTVHKDENGKIDWSPSRVRNRNRKKKEEHRKKWFDKIEAKKLEKERLRTLKKLEGANSDLVEMDTENSEAVEMKAENSEVVEVKAENSEVVEVKAENSETSNEVTEHPDCDLIPENS
ncbi:hypothetical protein TKK_0006195 [Trichogramma kaykai]|uniref:non-specific serine/threonine protein kinase n=1 Tax=Trichogramma kaykai TaxID=54128 RepID=A0ABD2XFV3_9HYME